MAEVKKPPFSLTVVVGLGGVWSRLCPDLGDLSTYTEAAPKRLLLIDGDDIEEKNMARQGFLRQDVKRKKAEIWEGRMRKRYLDLSISSKGEYVTPKNVVDLIPDGSIILSCVDNNATRLLLSKRAQELKNVLLISGGNELWDGNVQLYVRVDGEPKQKAIEEVHQELKDPKDKNPGEMSCEELMAQKGGEQILITNGAVAQNMISMFYDVLVNFEIWRGKEVPRPSEVMFDVREYLSSGYVRMA